MAPSAPGLLFDAAADAEARGDHAAADIYASAALGILARWRANMARPLDCDAERNRIAREACDAAARR